MTSPSIHIKGSASINGETLFAPIDVTLNAGAWTCLLGGSGVGKSTILRLIAGLETGASFEGQVSASDNELIADRVAFMAQDDLLLPWSTVEQNIALGAKMRGEQVDQTRLKQLAERVGLTDHLHKRPNALSGGQKQRVALARTLMEDRPIILLDEPFSALDAQTRMAMQDLAAQTLVGKTVLIVTHDPSEAARLGEQVLILKRSGILRFDPPSTRAPRDVSAAETLAFQGALFETLREGTV